MRLHTFEAMGYHPPNPAASRLHQELHVPSAGIDNEEGARNRAEHLNLLMDGPVPEEVLPNLEQFEGRWHPSGFMVFQVAEHPDPERGSVRLHVWPKGLRKREHRGRGSLGGDIWDGDFHTHAWPVSGYNIKGYRDMLVDVEQMGIGLSDEEVAVAGLFRIFRVTYNRDSGEDELTTQGECVATTPREERHLSPTDVHEVRVGDYHAPMVPYNEFAATLAFNPHRVVSNGPEILIGGKAVSIVGARETATIDEKLLAKAQVLAALGRNV